MVFEKYSYILTRDFSTLDTDREQKKTPRQKLDVLLNGTKTAETDLISCKTIII